MSVATTNSLTSWSSAKSTRWRSGRTWTVIPIAALEADRDHVHDVGQEVPVGVGQGDPDLAAGGGGAVGGRRVVVVIGRGQEGAAALAAGGEGEEAQRRREPLGRRGDETDPEILPRGSGPETQGGEHQADSPPRTSSRALYAHPRVSRRSQVARDIAAQLDSDLWSTSAKRLSMALLQQREVLLGRQADSSRSCLIASFHVQSCLVASVVPMSRSHRGHHTASTSM